MGCAGDEVVVQVMVRLRIGHDDLGEWEGNDCQMGWRQTALEQSCKTKVNKKDGKSDDRE